MNQTLQLQIVSDLHLDSLEDPISKLQSGLIIPSAHVLAVIGDTCSLDGPMFEEFLNYVAPRFKHVLIVNGNHEYYSETTHTIQQLKTSQVSTISQFDNVTLLDNSFVDIDGFRIVGSTLWSHISMKRVTKH